MTSPTNTDIMQTVGATASAAFDGTSNGLNEAYAELSYL